MARSPALRRLKDETADLHLAAEGHVHILDPAATARDYRDYLGAMLGFHRPMEARLAVLDPLGFASPSRRKAHLLESDLRALGDEAGWPDCARLPALPGIAEAIGAAYVLEGSTLGGRFILSRLPPRLARLSGVATAFLDGYGAATGARWRDFAGVVERGLVDDAAVDAAVAGARATFTALSAWRAAPAREAVA